MVQMVINSFVRDARVPKNLKVLRFRVLKSSIVWMVMNSNSVGTSMQIYTSVTAMWKIRKAISEFLRQLGGKKFKKSLFKRISAAHANSSEVNRILEQIVMTCEEFCA